MKIIERSTHTTMYDIPAPLPIQFFKRMKRYLKDLWEGPETIRQIKQTTVIKMPTYVEPKRTRPFTMINGVITPNVTGTPIDIITELYPTFISDISVSVTRFRDSRSVCPHTGDPIYMTTTNIDIIFKDTRGEKWKISTEKPIDVLNEIRDVLIGTEPTKNIRRTYTRHVRTDRTYPNCPHCHNDGDHGMDIGCVAAACDACDSGDD